jgi:hypothetical protein
MNKKTLYINLSVNAKAEGKSLSVYLFGGCKGDEVNVVSTEDGVDVIARSTADEGGREFLSARELSGYISGTKAKYERVVVNAPDILVTTDAYAVASYCDKVILGCKRRDITGTDLYEINNTMDNNEINIDGVVVYGN